MRAVLQRVLHASVEVDGVTVASIGKGIMVLAGLHESDTKRDMDYIAVKILGARVFDDANGVMNLAVGETDGEVLLISQFTLYGDIRRGKRPSYSSAMKPDAARTAFSRFVEICTLLHPATRAGIFGADMKVSLLNDGPVTILVDSGRLF